MKFSIINPTNITEESLSEIDFVFKTGTRVLFIETFKNFYDDAKSSLILNLKEFLNKLALKENVKVSRIYTIVDKDGKFLRFSDIGFRRI